MDDLVQFLRARLDEDEQTAKALCNDTRPGRIPQWEHCDDGAIRDAAPHEPVLRVRFTWAPEAAHVIRHGPARVLAEVDAKRQILDEHPPGLGWDGNNLDGPVCRTCAETGTDGGLHGDPYPCTTLRLLALPYADRPGYREEWRPTG